MPLLGLYMSKCPLFPSGINELQHFDSRPCISLGKTVVGWGVYKTAKSESMRARELAPLLAACCTGLASLGNAGELGLMVLMKKTVKITNPATSQTQTQKQGYYLLHPKIYLIYEMVEHYKEPDLLIQSVWISVT